MRKKPVTVAVSGGFDPVHIGHVRMIQEARKQGDRLVVILNNDAWLIDKKGYAFMPEAERKEILEAIAGVDEVVITDHTPGDRDRSVCRALSYIRPQVFANGGDRKPDGDPVPEVLLCEELGIELVYNIGHGGKVQSSSELAKRALKIHRNVPPRNPLPASCEVPASGYDEWSRHSLSEMIFEQVV